MGTPQQAPSCAGQALGATLGFVPFHTTFLSLQLMGLSLLAPRWRCRAVVLPGWFAAAL